MADLAALQRAFYDRVTRGVAADGLAASGELEVYAEMYAIRLIDVLAGDFPKLHAAVGDHHFRQLATSYLRAHPPTAFTMRELGASFADHLRSNDHAPAWAGDLAALERGRHVVWDGADVEPLERDEVIALGEELPELAVRWVTSHAVVALTWTVDDLWSAIEDAEGHEITDAPFEHPAPEPTERTVLVWRVLDTTSVLHRTLDDDEAGMAVQISTGASFGEICEVLSTLHGDDAVSRAAQLLMRWLDASALTRKN
ncbi:MAG TPA: DNA-binding domain-containing protein [Kofleriaceae bacterium]